MADSPPRLIPIPVTVVPDDRASEMYASIAMGFALDGPNLKLTFASDRADHDGPTPLVKRVVIGRVVMPLPAARMMVEEAFSFLQKVAPERKPTAS